MRHSRLGEGGKIKPANKCWRWTNRYSQIRSCKKIEKRPSPYRASSSIVSRSSEYLGRWYVHFTLRGNVEAICKKGLIPSLAVNGFGVYAYMLGSVYDCTTHNMDGNDSFAAIWFKTDMVPAIGGIGQGEVRWSHVVKFSKVVITTCSEAYALLNSTGFTGSHGMTSVYYYDGSSQLDPHVHTGTVDDYGNTFDPYIDSDKMIDRISFNCFERHNLLYHMHYDAGV